MDNTTEKKTLEKATFGAGCFWGVEAAYRQIKGVVSTAVGFSGGTLAKPCLFGNYEGYCRAYDANALLLAAQDEELDARNDRHADCVSSRDLCPERYDGAGWR